MRGIGIFGVSLWAACTCLSAASYWADSGATVDEAVAGRGKFGPSLSQLDAALPKGLFRYPHVDNLENITFIVDSNDASHGIYRSLAVSRKLSQIIQARHTVLPNSGATAAFIQGLQTDGADFVFTAIDSQDQTGLYLWQAGQLKTIARTGRGLSPQASTPLTGIDYGSLSNGRVLFTAQTSTTRLLSLYEEGVSQTRVLLHSGQPIPGHPEETFEYFSPQNWIAGRDIVFRAARVMDPHDETLKGGNRGLYGWFDVDSSQPEACTLKNLQTIADWTTPIPGLEGKTFTDFRSAPVCKGLVAFVGGCQNSEGVYLYDAHAREKKIRLIVDTETRLPKLFEGPFTDFGIFPTIIDDCVVFTAEAAGGYMGVFLYNASTDTLSRLADTHTEIGGKNANGFEIAGHFLVRNRFALAASFKDGPGGIYLATIPVESFVRMGAPGL